MALVNYVLLHITSGRQRMMMGQSGSKYIGSGDRNSSSAKSKRLGYRFVKRAFDIVFSGAVIVVGFIPGAILSLFIYADTKGSPLYVQERVGKGGKPFKLFKFRTMVADSDNVEKYFNEEQMNQWLVERKVDNDPRITKLGNFLRKTSIDEIPNFINVFLGQMSTVGPRAITEGELVHFGSNQVEYLSIPAGITGWWQIEARNDATFESGTRQQMELFYVHNASIELDLKIIIKTFGAMFGKNRNGR